MNMVMNQNIRLEVIAEGFMACHTGTGEVHRIEGPAGQMLARIMAGDPAVDTADPVVAALLDTGIVTAAGGHGRASTTGISRRTMIAAASAVGITTLLLPNAAAASSEVGGSGGEETGGPAIAGATFLFSQVSGSQFGFNWIRDAADDATPFQYEVEVTATLIPEGQTVPTTNPYTYGPYDSTASGSSLTTNRQVVFISPLYGGSFPDYGSVTGTVFTATFRSLTTPASTVTINCTTQNGTGAW